MEKVEIRTGNGRKVRFSVFLIFSKILNFDHFRSEFQLFSLQRPPLMSGLGYISLPDSLNLIKEEEREIS